MIDVCESACVDKYNLLAEGIAYEKGIKKVTNNKIKRHLSYMLRMLSFMN